MVVIGMEDRQEEIHFKLRPYQNSCSRSQIWERGNSICMPLDFRFHFRENIVGGDAGRRIMPGLIQRGVYLAQFVNGHSLLKRIKAFLKSFALLRRKRWKRGLDFSQTHKSNIKRETPGFQEAGGTCFLFSNLGMSENSYASTNSNRQRFPRARAAFSKVARVMEGLAGSRIRLMAARLVCIRFARSDTVICFSFIADCNFHARISFSAWATTCS